VLISGAPTEAGQRRFLAVFRRGLADHARIKLTAAIARD
jgi:hypothetical protein